jgi:hypothetical protein
MPRERTLRANKKTNPTGVWNEGAPGSTASGTGGRTGSPEASFVLAFSGFHAAAIQTRIPSKRQSKRPPQRLWPS